MPGGVDVNPNHVSTEEHQKLRRALCAEIAGYIRDEWLVPDPCDEVEEHLNSVMLDLASRVEKYAGAARPAPCQRG
jgi:glutamate dehydrogenase/leucine dehydrogenase